MLDITPQETKLLQRVYRSEDGKALVEFLNKQKNKLSSVDSIESGKDYGAQVEGRKLFKDIVEQITNIMETNKHKINPLEIDDYE